MKKSFKKVVAILLAVMMIVCSVPLTVFASDDANRANINLQFGDVSCTTTKKTVLKPRSAKMADYLTHSGLNSDKLTYSNGKIDGYATGDFFTVSVLLENVTELSAAEVAIKYSEAIEPAYIIDYKGRGDNVTVAYMYNEVTTEGPHADFPINEAIPTQSGNALYNSTSTLGETSYVDPEARIMHANFAVQTGADSVSLTDSKAVLATFMFKIVNDQPITFSIDNTQGDPYETYTLGTIANGGKVEEYKTYAKVSEADVPALDFMGENEYNGTVGKNYTITFIDADGQQISAYKYKEGTAIVPPSLPATTHDDAQHYTYAWDKEIPATATADGTYTIIKTGAAHTWDAGVTTKEPTATEAGEKTFTCTFDGCGATRTESLPATGETHTHTWSDWTYNGDAVYVNKSNYTDGTASRHCTDPNCPDSATETKTIPGTALLRASAYSLVLNNSLTADFKVTIANVKSYASSMRVEVTRNNKVTEYLEPSSTDSTAYHYVFAGIPPQCMKDDIDVVVHATYDGIDVWGPVYTRSIFYYANSLLNNAAYTSDNATAKNKAMRTMLVDMLNYGSAVQTLQNYKTDDYANSTLTDTQKSWASDDIATFNTVKNYHAIRIDNPTARFNAGGLVLDAAVVPRMTFSLKTSALDINDITVDVEIDGKTFTYDMANTPDSFQYVSTGTTTTYGEESKYYLFIQDAKAYQMSSTLSITIKKDGVAVSDTATYSVESYVQQVYNSSSATTKAVYMNMMKYGNAALAYGKA